MVDMVHWYVVDTREMEGTRKRMEGGGGVVDNKKNFNVGGVVVKVFFFLFVCLFACFIFF